MPTFAFQARTKSGEQIAGTREAADIGAAREALRAAEMFVTELQLDSASMKKTRGAEAASRQIVPPQIVPAQKMQAQTMQAQTMPVHGGGVAVVQPAHAGGRPPQIATPGATPPQATTPPQVATPQEGQNGPRVGSEPLRSQPLLTSSNKATSLYFRQMYAMLNSGTGIAQAMHTMATHAPSSGLRSASGQMAERALAGHPVSRQMEAFPGLFSNLQIGLVEAGENGGFLDRMYLRLAEYSEHDYELEQAIKRETWYPKMLVFCAILIPASVPTVLAVLGGRSGFGAFLGAAGPKLALLALIWIGWSMAIRILAVGAHGGVVRELIDGLKLVLPIQAKVTRALAAAKFARAMGALYASGVGAAKMVDVAAGACGNAAFAARVRQVIPRLQNGEEMTMALASTKQFPAVAIQMMYTGEASGRLDEQMDKVADFLEADAETAIKQAVKVLGILAFLVIAVIVAVQVAQQYLGTINSIIDEGNKMGEGN